MVGPKTQLLPLLLLLLLFLSALSFFSYHHSSLLISLSNPNLNLNLTLHPQIPNFTFIIKVLAYNCLDSLSRCLRSLAATDYLSDPVHLHLHIDHFPLADADYPYRKLQESRRILDLVDGFEWKFGDKVVHYRTQNAGLQTQWLKAWWPNSDHEFAFVVEDDLEVLPLYYKFLKNLIVNYYYNASNSSPYIYGASLQQPRRRAFFRCLMLFLLGLVPFGHIDDDAEIRSHGFNFEIKQPHINVQFDDGRGDQVGKRREDLVLDLSHVVPVAEKYDDDNLKSRT